MATTQELLAESKAQLRGQMTKLRAAIDHVLSESAPVRERLAAKVAQQNALDAEIADLAAQAEAIEQPRLHELKTELADVARAESAIRV